MKRRILSAFIILIALTGAVSTSAQFRYGPTAGVNMSTLKFKQKILDVDKSVGFTAGIAGELMFPGIGFGIDLGLMYDQRGATMNFGDFPMWADRGFGKERSYLHYIDIPIHLRFKYTRLNGFEDILAPFVFAGPSVGILVAHNKIEALEYATGELGIDFGIGAEIKRNWQVSFNYNWGMTYALKAKILTNYSARNSTYGLRVAYLF